MENEMSLPQETSVAQGKVKRSRNEQIRRNDYERKRRAKKKAEKKVTTSKTAATKNIAKPATDAWKKWTPARRAKFKKTMKAKRRLERQQKKAAKLNGASGSSIPLDAIPARVSKGKTKRLYVTKGRGETQPLRVQLAFEVIRLLQMIFREEK